MASIPPPRTGEPASAERAVHEVLAFSGELLERSRRQFAGMMSRLARRLTGSEQQAAEALASGGFVLDGATVVLRYNEELAAAEFFCDLGLPQPGHELAVFRQALEINLCRRHPGVMLGVHPDSGRLVATCSMHMMLLDDDAACENAVRMFAALVAEIRDSSGFALA